MIKLLYIDLFCGAGGTSTGVEHARHSGRKCAKVVACVNHDANAIASHAANHPDALHFTEDIRTLELSPLVSHIKKMKAQYPGARVVLWASLECTQFSRAKGGQSRDAESRTLAEHLFRYIEAIDPDYIQIENVEEFMSWGDLDEHGKPISRDSGRLYHTWVSNVKGYGYDFGHHILNAADYGAYTSRRRFFGQFAKHGLPIAWPEPTHSKKQMSGIFGQLKRWKPVKEVLDFSDEGESIFTRKKPLSDKTMERIYTGLIKFVAGGKDRFLSAYYGNGKGFESRLDRTAKSINKPCGVITTSNRFAKVQVKFLSKYYSGHPDSKNKSINEPADTVTPVDHHALVSTSFIQRRNGGNPEHKVTSVERPARTITATGGNQELVQLEFLSAYYGNGYNHSVDEPCPVVTTADRFAKVRAQFLPRYNSCPNQGVNAVSVEAPSPTLTVKDRLSLVSPKFIVNEYSGGGQHSSIDEACPAILTKPKQKVISCQNAPKRYFFTSKTDIEYYIYDSEPTRRIKEFMALYGIIDIKMRMLKIPELKRIMGFPEGYTLIGTQAEQKKYIGNAVEVNMARVLCEALVREIYKLKNF